MVKEENNKNLENLIKEIKEKFGEGAIMRLDEARKVNVNAVSTGSLSLDLALGVNGVPQGRVIEIYGPESSGKTTLALHIIAEAQKRGGQGAFVDAEHALDPEYAKKIGVKIKDLLISQPDNGEQALDIVESLVRSGAVGVIVIDSVAALTPRMEIEGEMGDQQVGLQARLMSRALRKLTAISSKSQTIIIFINQVRAQIGVFFGNPETTPGGKALRFYSSVRIEIRKSAQLKKGELIIGNKVKVKVVKNKVAPPFKTAEFDIIYNEGISYESDILNLGLKYEVIKKLGNTLIFDNQKIGVGLENSRQFLKTNSQITKKIAEAIKKVYLEKNNQEI